MIYVQLLLGLLGEGTLNPTTDPTISLVDQTEERQNSVQGAFFVALASSADRIYKEKTPSEGVFTATNRVISPGIVRTEGFQHPQEPPVNHRKEQKPSDEPVIEQVEYFDLIEKYEKESGDNIITVKGNLRKNLLFWKNVLLANDFILNVIEFG